MSNWTTHLSPAQARAILDAKIKTRFSAPDASGIWRTRYTALTSAERASLQEIAGG